MLINLFSAINSPFSKTTGRNEFLKYSLLKTVLLFPIKDNTFYLHHHLGQHHIQVLQWFRSLSGPNKMKTRENFIKNYMQNIHSLYSVFLSTLLAFTCSMPIIEISQQYMKSIYTRFFFHKKTIFFCLSLIFLNIMLEIRLRFSIFF